MLVNKFIRLRSPDDVIGGGGIEDAVHEDTDLEADAGPDTEVSDDTATETEVTPAAKPDATAELVALLKAQAEEKKAAQAAATAPKQLTPEELEAKWGRVTVSQEDLANIGFLEASPEQVKGMQALLDKVVNYALNKAGHTVEDRFSKAESEYSPLKQEYLARQQEAHRNSFYTKYPSLKGKEELVGLVAQSLKSNPATANMPTDKLFDLLNTTTLSMLKKHGISPSSAQPSPQKTAPKPNSLSTAGGSTETKPKSEGSMNPQQAAAMRLRS